MTAPIPERSAQARYDAGYERSAGYPGGDGDAWLAYSIVLLAIAGCLNLIGGIAAISDSKFYIHDTHYVLASLKTWGWVVTLIGVVQLLSAVGIYQMNQMARWIGVFSLSLNAIAQLLMLPAYPFWSLAIFALDVIAIYGLIAYGSKPVRR
jgi:hypothetical protein